MVNKLILKIVHITFLMTWLILKTGSSLIKIGKKSYGNIYSVNPLYLIIGKADEWYIKGNNGNKYLVFTCTDPNKKVLTKF